MFFCFSCLVVLSCMFVLIFNYFSLCLVVFVVGFCWFFVVCWFLFFVVLGSWFYYSGSSFVIISFFICMYYDCVLSHIVVLAFFVFLRVSILRFFGMSLYLYFLQKLWRVSYSCVKCYSVFVKFCNSVGKCCNILYSCVRSRFVL